MAKADPLILFRMVVLLFIFFIFWILKIRTVLVTIGRLVWLTSGGFAADDAQLTFFDARLFGVASGFAEG